MFSTEFEMLCEAFPGVRSSTKRVRTTSESSAVPLHSSSSSGPGTPRNKCEPEVLRPSCQVPKKFQGLCIDSKVSKGGSSLDLCDPGTMRPRTGSKGIRDLLRLVTSRSSADENNPDNGCHGNNGNSNGGHVILLSSSRLTQLKDAMRERSRSDASSIQRPHKRRSNEENKAGKTGSDAERGEAGPHPPHPPPPSGGRRCRCGGADQTSPGRACGGCSAATLQTLRVSGFPVSNGDARNPIHSPLSPLGRVRSPNHIGPAEFIELYRERAQSDPRPQARMQALDNVRRKRMQTARLVSSPGYAGLEEKKLVLWKDKKEGNQLLVLPGEGSEDTKVESIRLDQRVQLTYCDLLKATKCYDIIPNSTKMVILDSQLSVKKALYALLNNGLRSAPIWNSETQQLSGMLTVTDFILVLQRYYLSQPQSIESLEEHSISTFKAITDHAVSKRLTSIRPEENLLDAIFALRHHAVHRLPVIDPSTGNIIYMMTYKRLLNFLHMAISKHVAGFMSKTLEELKIGTYEDIATVHLDTAVIDALKLLVDRQISSLPVVNSNRKLVSMFSRADVINLAAEKTYTKLDTTIGDAQSGQEQRFCVDSTATCQKTDTLMAVVAKLSRREIHRLPVLDVSGHVTGVVSVSDIVRFVADRTEVDS